MKKNTILAITFSVVGFGIMSLCSYVTVHSAQYKTTLVPQETEMVEAIEVINGVGDDANRIEVYPNRYEVYEDDILQATIKTNNTEYELCEVVGCQYDKEGHTDFEVPYGTGNSILLYGVYDHADDSTNRVLIRKGKNICHDEIVFYGTVEQ